MNDELHQLYRETLDRIIFGIVTIGLVAGLAALLAQGADSPWVGRSIALVAVAGVAYIVRLVGLYGVAAFIITLVLFGLTVDVLLQSDAPLQTSSFLFIPVILVAGLLLKPAATLLVTAAAGAAPLLVAYFTGQFSSETVYSLLPFLGISLLFGLLITQNKLNFTKLGNRLVQNRILLKERALQLMQNMKRVEFLEGELATLRKQLKEFESKANRQQTNVTQENGHFYELLQGTIQELHAATAELERSIERMSALPNGQDTLDAAWQKLLHLRSLAVNLEAMAQVDQHDFKLQYDTVNIKQLIAEVASTARGLVYDKPIEVREQIGDNVSTLRADPDRLRQVLLHLVHNAVKYTDQGAIEIRAEMDESELVIFVSDTGLGVSNDEAEQVFERFGRSASNSARERQGVGLGLAICKRLVELHQGRIWLTSVPDEGSTFYLALPLDPLWSKAASPVYSSHKPTLRLRTVSDSEIKAHRPAAPLPTSAPSRANEVILPASHRLGQDAAGETILIPRQPAAAQVSGNDGAAQAMLRGKDYRAKQLEPIRRFQPTYIRRFGFILLGMLFTVMFVVAILAIANTGAAQNEAGLATGTVASLATVTTVPTVSAAAVSPTFPPAASQASAIAPVSATNEEQGTALEPPTATPTFRPTATPMATATPVEVSVAPTAAALNRPSPTATPSPPPTATRLLLPTSTPVFVILTPTPTPAATAITNAAAIPAAVVEAAPPPAPTATPAARLVFSAGQTIFSQQAAGAPAQVDLPLVLDSNSRLSWSPAGQLLFTGQQANRRDIFVTDSNASAVTNLTQSAADDFQPDWAPGGEQIAFSSGRTGNFDIFVMGADGSNPVQLTTARGFEEWPVWSPDGQKIVFVSDRDGNVELYTMNADGSNQQRLTNDPADDWPAAWSPDGQWLVFASNRDADWNLYLVSAAGGEPQRLTDAPGAERDPIWSPDGDTIAFVHDGGGNFDVYTLPLPPGLNSVVPAEAWTQVTNTPLDERFPTWGQSAP